MSDVEVVDVEDCYARVETNKALLIQLPDDDEVWVPKSQIEDDSEVYADGHNGKLVCTKWIAEQKGFLNQGTVRYVGP